MKTMALRGGRLRIAVVGPGAIGCLFAGLLAEAGHDVTLLDHRPSRARLLSKTGITIQTADGTRVVRVPATASAAEIGDVDIIFLCVKSYDTAAAISRAAKPVGPRTIVVSMQNGLGNAEQIARVVAPSRIVCGTTGHGVISLGPGHILHAGADKTRFAAFLPDGVSIARRIAAILRAAHFDATAGVNAESMLWSKLVINAAINPPTVIFNMRNGQMLNHPVARDIMLKAAEEAKAVAEANGVSLMFRDPAREVEAVCRRTGSNLSSMLQDVQCRRRTEIDSITGAIVRAARSAGVAVPVSRSLLRQVRAIESCRLASRGPAKEILVLLQ